MGGSKSLWNCFVAFHGGVEPEVDALLRPFGKLLHEYRQENRHKCQSRAFASVPLYDEYVNVRQWGNGFKNYFRSALSKKQILRRYPDHAFGRVHTRKSFSQAFVLARCASKWPNLRRRFLALNIDKNTVNAGWNVRTKSNKPGDIRNFNKVKTIRENAWMIWWYSSQSRLASAKFGHAWPQDDLMVLWGFLKEKGARQEAVIPGLMLCVHRCGHILLPWCRSLFFVEHG